MKDYEVVFDFGNKFPIFLLLFIALFIFFLIQIIQERKSFFKTFSTIPSLMFLSVGFIGILIYFMLWNTYLSKKIEVVEGIVYDFEPLYGNRDDNRSEKFKVKNVKFEYSDGLITYGFNKSKYYGGPMDNGKQVRISYIKNDDGNIILKLEIAK